MFLLLACDTEKEPDALTCEDEAAVDAVCTDEASSELFDRYIEPLVVGGQPSSCNQCHLSGVDLGMYVQDTPCQSMACLVELGMVDLADPTASEVLAQIQLAQPDSALITEEVIQREYDGFLEWIEWSASCQECVCGDVEDPCNAGTGTATTDVLTPLEGTCEESALAEVFDAWVWPYRDRCMNCHSETGIYADEVTPAWMADEGSDEAPMRTMYNVIGAGYLDLDSPADSSWLTKPLAGVVEHGGGDKFETTEDEAYVHFLLWIEEYAACWLDGAT